MIRILQYGLSNKYNGTESVILNLYRNIDRSRYQFDFLIDHRYHDVEYEAEVEALGGHIYREYYRINEAMQPGYISPSEFWRRHPEIQGGIHLNLQAYGICNIQLMAAAQNAGLPIRIIHMHNALRGLDKSRDLLQHTIVRPYAKRYANKFLACSQLAGNFGFQQNQYEIFHNAIDLDRFLFNRDTRNQIRMREHLADKQVLGFVGRFVPQKNVAFLLNVLREINKQRNDAVLVLIGDGELEGQLRHQAKEMNLENVIFKGRVNNVHEWMQAFDVFLLPSRFEGLPVVLIEAQASGLICLASDNVSVEAAITPKLSYLSLENPADWADAICNADFVYDRRKGRDEVAAAGYDIRESVKRLEAIYDELLNKKDRSGQYGQEWAAATGVYNRTNLQCRAILETVCGQRTKSDYEGTRNHSD